MTVDDLIKLLFALSADGLGKNPVVFDSPGRECVHICQVSLGIIQKGTNGRKRACILTDPSAHMFAVEIQERTNAENPNPTRRN